MTVGMGGRASEEVVFDEITSGAQNDLQQVTRVARTMVTQLGMADELGPVYFGGQEDGLNGASYNPWEPKEYSDETATRIDEAVQRLVSEAHGRARGVISENRSALDALAGALMREESLDREELTEIVNAHRAPGQEPIPIPTGQPTTIVDTPLASTA
jgi:cell division protease FtsH